MVRAQAVKSDRPKDTHDIYVTVERDGCRLLRVTTDEAQAIAHDRKVDERIRRVLHEITYGVREA